jgi:hypothetical protein
MSRPGPPLVIELKDRSRNGPASSNGWVGQGSMVVGIRMEHGIAQIQAQASATRAFVLSITAPDHLFVYPSSSRAAGWSGGMTTHLEMTMLQDIRVLSNDEILAVSGGACSHGTPGSCRDGKGDGLGWLRQGVGQVVGAVAGVISAVTGIFGF